MLPSKNNIYPFILILLSIFSLWLVWHYVITFRLAEPSNPKYPDAFVNNINIIKMDKMGHREYAFSSPFALQYSSGEHMQFTNPSLILYQSDQTPWTGKANEGEITDHAQKIILRGDVIFEQQKGENNPHEMINTQELIFYPHQKIATTDKLITAIQFEPYSKVVSTGMLLDLNAHTVKLLSHVDGVYEASAKKNRYTAPTALYDMKKRIITSPKTLNGRTTIVLDQKENSHA